jgi:hypothetical protein
LLSVPVRDLVSVREKVSVRVGGGVMVEDFDHDCEIVRLAVSGKEGVTDAAILTDAETVYEGVLVGGGVTVRDTEPEIDGESVNV